MTQQRLLVHLSIMLFMRINVVTAARLALTRSRFANHS